jgi:hypothetical protein
MKKRVSAFTLIAIALLMSILPETDAPIDKPTPPPQRARPLRSAARPAAWPAAASASPESSAAVRLPVERVVIQLRAEARLDQQIAVFSPFTPRDFIDILNPMGIPDTATGDAVADWLDPPEGSGVGLDDELLDAVDADPELEGFDQEWVDLIDLETERLLSDEQYADEEAEVMRQLEAAGLLPHADVWDALADLPEVDRDHEALLELASIIIDDQPMDPVADIARLYAARALGDELSASPSESGAAQLLLDTLANADEPQLVNQAIRMMVGLDPGELTDEDIRLLEHSWFRVDDDVRGLLSRFLMEQHFARGDLADALLWTDQLEAEVLSGELSFSGSEEFQREVHHARARIGARLGRPADHWQVALEQAAWHCWEGPAGAAVTPGQDNLRLRGAWQDEWLMHARPANHPLAGCILTELDELIGPDKPLRVEVHIKIFGLRD